MQYVSTRDCGRAVQSARAIADGISPEGGLYIPAHIPVLSDAELAALAGDGYPVRAAKILSRYLTDFTYAELLSFAQKAYGAARFDHADAAPIVPLGDGVFVQELWHGPTAAFKDMALQMLPYLLTASLAKTEETREVCVLVATSGDTGKAALEGFCDVPGTRVMVFYPQNGVSPVQKLQMTTQKGENVSVCAINGNFDDAQTGVKAIFASPAVQKALDGKNRMLSSANSINFGRLVPQVVYYVSAYCDLVHKGHIAAGSPINVCVPTGNFGNILSAYFAREMGVPIQKFLCASNRNNVLTDFISKGVYDKNRPFHTTISPSMDILISSNVERLLYLLSGGDAPFTAGCMASLAQSGQYQLAGHVKESLSRLFYGGFADDCATKASIARWYRETGYLADTHTAVALCTLTKYRAETGDKTPCVVGSTASPYKFAGSVLEALKGGTIPSDLAALQALCAETGVPIPAPLRDIDPAAERFTQCVEKEGMADFVLKAWG